VGRRGGGARVYTRLGSKKPEDICFMYSFDTSITSWSISHIVTRCTASCLQISRRQPPSPPPTTSTCFRGKSLEAPSSRQASRFGCSYVARCRMATQHGVDHHLLVRKLVALGRLGVSGPLHSPRDFAREVQSDLDHSVQNEHPAVRLRFEDLHVLHHRPTFPA
jgi:hypothetical protein